MCIPRLRRGIHAIFLKAIKVLYRISLKATRSGKRDKCKEVIKVLPRIVISQTSGSIAIDVRRAKLDFRPGRFEMSMSGNAEPQLRMRTKLPRVQIDQTAAFASAGLKKPLPMALDNFSKALQDGIDSIGTIAQESLEFLRIEDGGNPIASQSARIGETDFSLTVTSMPSAGPEIEVEQGVVNIDATPVPVQINWKWVEGQSEYTPYEVNITMSRYPGVEISVEPGIELEFPVSTGMGSSVDTAV